MSNTDRLEGTQREQRAIRKIRKNTYKMMLTLSQMCSVEITKKVLDC